MRRREDPAAPEMARYLAAGKCAPSKYALDRGGTRHPRLLFRNFFQDCMRFLFWFLLKAYMQVVSTRPNHYPVFSHIEKHPSLSKQKLESREQKQDAEMIRRVAGRRGVTRVIAKHNPHSSA